MSLRCIWSYLLCTIKVPNNENYRQIALAWYSFGGVSYRRNGIYRTGARNIGKSLRHGEIPAEVIAWTLGFESAKAFSIGFQGSFSNVISSNGVVNIVPLGLSQDSASFVVHDDGLFANIRSDGVIVELNATKLGFIDDEFDKSDTSVVRGLSAFRWRSLELEGYVENTGTVEKILGRAYFQQVRSHLPLLPWDWCNCIFPDGSLAGISTLTIGRDLFTGQRFRDTGRANNFNKQIFSRGFFVDGKSGRMTRMNSSVVDRSVNTESGCHVNHITASGANGTHMRFDVTIQDSHSMKFSRDMCRLRFPIFHYQSSLGNVDRFVFERGEEASESRSFDEGICNLEKTSGFFL